MSETPKKFAKQSITESNGSSPKRRTTLKDVAQLAGVSINTVSAVLNPRRVKIVVKTETRQKVVQAAQQLNYRRNRAASRLAGGMSRTLGVITDNLRNPFHASILESFESSVLEQGYHSVLESLGRSNRTGLDRFRDLLEFDIEGLLVTDIWQYPESLEAVKSIQQHGIPVVYLDQRNQPWPGPLVSGDHFQGGQLLADHLLKQGHRNMVFASSQYHAGVESVSRRYQGVQDRLSEEPSEDQCFCRQMLFESLDNKLLVQQQLQEIFDQVDRPTVIIAFNDHLAYTLIHLLQQMGKVVPDDIAVTGYDDYNHIVSSAFRFFDIQANLMGVSLTTVRQPVEELGRQAAQILIKMLQSPSDSEVSDCLVPVELIEGESSRFPRNASQRVSKN